MKFGYYYFCIVVVIVVCDIVHYCCCYCFLEVAAKSACPVPNVHDVVCMMLLSSRFPGSCEIVTGDSLEAFGIGQSVSLDYKLP